MMLEDNMKIIRILKDRVNTYYTKNIIFTTVRDKFVIPTSQELTNCKSFNKVYN